MKKVLLLALLSHSLFALAQQKKVHDSLGTNHFHIPQIRENAEHIIKKTIQNIPLNDPEQQLKSYQYKSYSKLTLTASPENINGAIDSVFIKKKKGLKLTKIDSTYFKLKEQLDKSHLFITEKLSLHKFEENKTRTEKVIASKVPGFKRPVYELLSVTIQSFSLYKNKYTLLGTEYTGPLAKKAFQKYNYELKDSISENNNKTYVIAFSPKRKKKGAGLEGTLFIDAKTYAITKGEVEIDAAIKVKAIEFFEYHEEENIWFPTHKTLKLSKGDNNTSINLFGGALEIADLDGKTKNEKEIHTNNFTLSEVVEINAEEAISDIELNSAPGFDDHGYAIEVDRNAFLHDEGFWNSHRTNPITPRELHTYKYADSIARAEKAERKIGLIRKLLVGYFPFGPLDLDTKSVIKYNNYEGFRLGAGLTTNNKFSNVLQLNTYAAFGTKDKDLKYGFGAAVRLFQTSSTWFGVDYIDDLVESGSTSFTTDTRAFSIFEPRLFNISMFHNSKRIAAYVSNDFTPQIQTKLRLQKADIIPKYTYSYLNNETAYNTYKVTTASLSVQWSPFSKYMLTPEGKKVIKNEYPQFTFQATNGFKNLFDGYFNFTKLDFRARYNIQPLNKGKTTFLLQGGLAHGDLPLTHLYHTSPNQPDGNAILQRFSVGGGDSFETMFFNEFFSDRYAAFHAKHYFKRVKLIGKLKPEFVLASRFAIGDIKAPEKHSGISFQSLNKGYMESGFEINKILKGFGLAFMYRYGAYHLPDFDDNISLKFTYYFSLGF